MLSKPIFNCSCLANFGLLGLIKQFNPSVPMFKYAPEFWMSCSHYCWHYSKMPSAGKQVAYLFLKRAYLASSCPTSAHGRPDRLEITVETGWVHFKNPVLHFSLKQNKVRIAWYTQSVTFQMCDYKVELLPHWCVIFKYCGAQQIAQCKERHIKKLFF